MKNSSSIEKSTRLLLICVIAFFTVFAVNAQVREVSGVVTDAETGEPLIGVNVAVTGTTTGTITSADGSYSINVPSGQTLHFSYVGYESQNVTITDQTRVNVSLVMSTEEIDEVVVIGYGTMKRSDLTGAVSSISEEDIATTKSSNVIEALQGKVAGVDMVRSSGEAGSGYSILLRGARSLTASNSPIYIVDGIDYGSNININPNDIASMEVLKDASSTAIYGSRGANGVILITTKKGQAGKPVISFNTYYGITTPLGSVPLGDADYFLRMTRDFLRTTRAEYDWDTPDDEIDVGPGLSARENEGYAAGTDFDWVDAQMEDYGTQQDYHLSVTGGNETTNYAVSLNHMLEDNFIPNDYYKRYSIKSSLESSVTDWLRLGNSTFIAYSNRVDGEGINYNMNPLTSAYDSLGYLVPEPNDRVPFENPLINQDPKNYFNEIIQTDLFSTFYAELNLLEGLTFRSSFNIDLGFNRNGFFEGEYEGIDRLSTASSAMSSGYKWTWQNVLTYDRTFDDHHVILTGATETMYNKTERSYQGATDLLLGNSWWWALTSGQQDLLIAPAGDEGFLQLVENQLVSFIGRVHYGFRNKYLVTFTGRYDGASQLADKWDFFPSASVAWRVSEESFMDNVEAISNLKIRLGYGQTGNQSVSPYAALGSIIRTPLYYEFGTDPYLGYRTGYLDNPDLTWETTTATNVGLDFGLFKNRISGALELYQTHTSDLLQNRTLPPTSAVPEITQNVGETMNRGIELSLRSVNVSTSDFNWTTDVTFSANREEITFLVGGVEQDIGNGWFVGHPISVFYDYEKIGIWQLGEEEEAALYGRVPGMLKLNDVNNDSLINDEDRVILGTPRPKWTAGINSVMRYKNFDLTIFAYARIGHTVSDGIIGQWSPDRRENSMERDYWTPNNPTNEYPRLDPGLTRSGWSEATALRYKDGSYVKIRDITLGYTLPMDVTMRANITSIRLYATLKNYFAFGKYYSQGRYDPEYRGAMGKPIPKMVAIGANFTF
ncbi:MAG TPA: TonB-dependent receptor [Bacteroides sp.]|nr:TonB-dependent receptor [Bacteroides sp.]